MRLHSLYSLLVVVAMTFAIACDDSDEVVTEGGTEAGATAGGTEVGGADAGAETEAGAEAGTEAGTGAGTETEAGTGAGTETEAGTETFAGTETEAGTEPEMRVGPGDTDPVACEGDYCPSARLSGLTIPTDPAMATASGCRLSSDKNGTGLSGLLALAGGDLDTNAFVTPDDEGVIELVLLNHLAGWAAGMSGNNAGSLTANFYTGVQSEDGTFMVDPVSLNEEGKAIISFEETVVTDGLYLTPRADFIVDLPIAELPLQLRLSQTEISGFVTTDSTGFNMTEGVLGGYLTKAAIIELIDGINAVCAGDTPPELCGTVESFLSGDAETDLALLVPLIGGFDSAVAADGSTSACSSDNPDCNAISVCILVEMESAAVTGVAPPEE